MKKINWILLSFILVACSSTPKLPITSTMGVWDSQALEDSNGVILIPQWHLSPQTNTNPLTTDPPQSKNQSAIFYELSEWITNNYVQSIVVEGCEGILSENPDLKFNGWSLNDLQKEKNINNVQTHIGLKLLAKFKQKADVECGDNLELVKKNQISLSDIRAILGFKLRIEQKDLSAADKKKFVEGAREMLQMPKTASVKDIQKNLNSELAKSIAQFEDLISQRNNSFLQKISKLNGRKVILIGAIHINDLKKKLTDKKIPFSVWKPIGLSSEDEDFLQKLKNLF